MIDKPNLSESEIQQNYEEFLEILPKHFKGERLKKLEKMYGEDAFGSELATAPASMCSHYHNCFPGGYLLHINNVLNGAFVQKKAYEMMGANMDFTDEELAFAAIHHDLGKLGSPGEGTYYLPQDEDWKSRKGELYKMNPNIQYVEVPQRAIFNLQYYGIKITLKESLGILLSDGMYSEASQKYLKTFNKDMYLRSNLPRIVHAADYMATRGEFDRFMSGVSNDLFNPTS